MKILPTSQAIRDEITRLMAPGARRRVAISAFVGDGARAYLPRPNGVELICWPKAGGTNPRELRWLKRGGANIRFADFLHMKLYWAKNRGVVVTSANLSTNALGSGDLKEFGVLLPPTAIDISRVIASLRSRPFNKRDMKKLEKEHRKLVASRPQWGGRRVRISFTDWYSLPDRPEWRLTDTEEAYVPVAREAAEIVRRYFNRDTVEDRLTCKERYFRDSDWVLKAQFAKRPIVADWMYVDFVVKVRRTEKRLYDPRHPFQAVQIWSPRHYASPPFAVTAAFLRALADALEEYGVKRFERLRSTRPPTRLLDLTAEKMKGPKPRRRKP